ncbi:hypothetical protein [Nonomuraea sp. NPDC002799]
MMYGPPPDYPRAPEFPRATSSPTIILLVSGLAALLGFLLGVFVGFGAGTTTPEEAAPRTTVTIEETGPAQSAVPAETGPSQTGPTQSGPAASAPVQTPPGQSAPVQSPPGQGAPTQTPPGQTGAVGGVPSGFPSINLASMRTLIVGTDIQPGTYRTAGPIDNSPACYWARLRSVTGGEIATGMPTGAATVTIASTDKAFLTAGCAEWGKA